MFLEAVLDPWSILIFVAITSMCVLAGIWMRKGQQSMDMLDGGLTMLRRLARGLNPRHPIRVRGAGSHWRPTPADPAAPPGACGDWR